MKWKRDSTSEDLWAFWPPMIKQDNVSNDKRKYEFRNDMTALAFVSQKISNGVYRKSLKFLYNMPEESSRH